MSIKLVIKWQENPGAGAEEKLQIKSRPGWPYFAG